MTDHNKPDDSAASNAHFTVEDWKAQINRLGTTELQLLNQLICDRMDHLYANDLSDQMANFRIGQPVTFNDKQGNVQFGEVMKLNRKTISIRSTEGKKWNVSPHLLTQVRETGIQSDLDLEFDFEFNKTQQPPRLQQFSSQEKPQPLTSKDWVAGLFDFPGLAGSDNEQDHFQPEAYLWIDGDGFIRHASLPSPLESSTPDSIVNSFKKAMEQPVSGEAEKPLTVRTDCDAIIQHLSPLYPDIKFIKSAVPEISTVVKEMTDALTTEHPDLPFSESEISDSEISAFFVVAAKLYESSPWLAVPDEKCLINIGIDDMDIQDAVAVIIGQSNLYYGFMLFESLEDYHTYIVIADSKDVARAKDIPAHRVLTFESVKSIGTEHRKEIMEKGWTLAGPDAYPSLFLPIKGGITRPIESSDLTLMSVVSEALQALTQNTDLVNSSWHEGKLSSTIQRVTARTKTGASTVEVKLSLPALPSGKTPETLNVVEKMTLVFQRDTEIADDEHQDLMLELEEAFLTSPEGEQLTERAATCHLIMQIAYNYLNTTISVLTPTDLEEILYEIIPRKVMVDATEADQIIDDSLAFFKFMERTYQLPYATECLNILDNKAKQKLRHALTDPSKFGIGKSIVTGNELPFSSLSDTDAFQQTGYLPGELSAYDPLPTVRLPKVMTAKEKKKRKDKRKNTRKARKKARRN